MKFRISLVTAALLAGCIIEQPAPQLPTAQQIANQIEQDYAQRAAQQSAPERRNCDCLG
jgi:hypothetical protein